MKNSEKRVEGPAEYISWAIQVLKEFYVVIDVDDADSNESDTGRYKEYYIKRTERVV